MTKYLRDQPFQVGGSTEAYRSGWDRIFGKKCFLCQGTGEIAKTLPLLPTEQEGISLMGKTTCVACGGSGREPQS